MTDWKALKVNLASQPLRNRRFFFTCVGVLTAAFLFVSYLAGSQFIKYRRQEGGAGQKLARIAQLRETAQREKAGWAGKIQDLSGKYKEKIDLINTLILKKSFSWVEFFSLLEQALPASSYITGGMAPEQISAGKLLVHFKVVTQNYAELQELVQNLYSLKFQNVLVINETRIEGQMVSEISASYERMD
jgi:hypothetical protein